MKERLKINKNEIIASIACLVPILIGLLFSNQLPESVPVHFDIHGVPDSYASKTFAIWGLPLILFAIEWFVIIAIKFDPKNQRQSEKVKKMVVWLVPLIGLLIQPSTLLFAMGYNVSITVVVEVLMGLLFIVVGNYLSKSRQNYTIGYKLPWTLDNEDNWNKTHRLASFVWVIVGLLILTDVFLKCSLLWHGLILGVLIGVLIFVPTIYSFVLYVRTKGND